MTCSGLNSCMNCCSRSRASAPPGERTPIDGQQEAIALGDDDVQAHVAGDEVLELVADRADQRRVDAEVGAGAQRIGGAGGAAAARRRGIEVEVGLVRVARVARRQVAAAGDAMEDPRLHGHGGLSGSLQISCDRRRRASPADRRARRWRTRGRSAGRSRRCAR